MVYLEDKKTGIWTNVRAQNTYTFTSVISDNIQRFNIHFEPPVSISSIDESCQINDGTINVFNPSNETWSVSVLHNGNEVYQGNISHGNTSVENLTAGVYILNLTGNNYATTEEVTIAAGTPIEAEFVLSGESFQTYDLVSAFVENPVDGANYTWYLNELFAGMGTSTSFAISDMGTYTISLDASLGNCKSSTSMFFDVQGTTSLTQVDKDDYLRAFPNPANEIVTIVWNENTVNYEVVNIMDISGRIVFSTQVPLYTEQFQLSTVEWKSGLYRIVVINETEMKAMYLSVVK
jgi:hypothetical protein